MIYFFLWFPMIVIAVFNGLVREKVLRRFLNEPAARRTSTLLLLLLFSVYIYFVLQSHPPRSVFHAWWIGLLWVSLTLAFEFGMGLIQKKSWKEMFEDYDLSKGRIWILVPLFILIAPWLYYVR